jgi:hypothetical protein
LWRYFNQALKKLNPWINDAQITEARQTLSSYLSSASLLQINEEKYFMIRDGIPVTVKKPNGKTEEKKARLTTSLENDLAACYRNTLDMCLENGLKSVAFCCISTGVFHFPNKRAAEIAVQTVTGWLSEHPGGMERVIFNVFKDEDKAYYEQLLQ